MTQPAESRTHNTDRILRLFARFISVGYLAYLAVLLNSITTLAQRMQPWWTPLAVFTVFGAGLLPGLLSFTRDSRAIRLSAAAAAGMFLLAALTWPLAWQGPQLPADDGVWLAGFPGLAGLAAVIAWPTAAAFGYLTIGCITVQVINTAARDGASVGMLVPEIAFSIMFCTLFVGAAAMALRTGRILDATTQSAHAAAAAAATRRARTIERERFDALIHDGVMATLLSAARDRPAAVSRLAAATMRELDELRTAPDSDRPFPADEALAHLRAAALAADPHARFVVQRHVEGMAQPIPSDVVRAAGAALAEATRNSRRHAGAAATRTVTVSMNDVGVEVAVADDGTGFDRSTVPPHRLGIAVSILAPMRQLAGGSAHIDSAPGAGTTVHLRWDAP
ncbi:sensor histidine kinase [Tomitella cavernea]|uniref:sensor histidine kinase n=1 Tax=Tomitella cavernea TaxID=1387982 RepID=UPI001904DF33|nr:sensor histidine kinase [Tomitella cavernea]